MDKEKMMIELGNSGLKRTSGIIYEEFLTDLKGTRKYQTYKEMRDNDSVIGAILFAIEMLVRQVDWRVQRNSNSEKDIFKADFLESCLTDMHNTWQETIAEILSMLTYGFSFHEIVYKRRTKGKSKYNDGFIGWNKIAIRSQDTLDKWDFNTHGEVTAFIQIAPPEYRIVRIPIFKGLLFKTTSQKNNPEGRSILRNAYRPWYFKKNIQEIEGIGIERDLAGLPVAWVPPEILDPNADTVDKMILEEIKNIITNIRRDEQEGVVFPLAYDENGNKLYDIKLLSTGGSREFDTNKIIERYDQRIAMTALADFILLGQKETGSYALASSKTELFATAIGTWLNVIAETFNRKAIPRLFKMNGWVTDNLPKLVHGDIEKIDLETIAKFVNNLAGAGATLFPNNELENYLLQMANLPTTESRDL